MHSLTRSRAIAILAVLALWMLVTRLPDASQLLHLRDASLAVFFIGGLLLRRTAPFVLLLVLAVGIDAVVFARTDMLHVCLSPAYAFLLPAYALLWFGGRALSQRFDGRAPGVALAAVTGVVCVVASFAVSNGSFYLLSGAFGELSVGGFASQFLRYSPGFVLTGSAWVCAGLAVVALLLRQGVLASTPRAA